MNGILSIFGRKCIEYDLERAITEGKLTPYKYYPVMVYLEEDELKKYEDLSYQISKNVTKTRNGKIKLNKYGEILAIKRSRVVAAAVQKLEVLEELMLNYQNEKYLLVYCGATNTLNMEADSSETEPEDIRQVIAVTKLLGNKLNMNVAKFTSDETIEERKNITEYFKDGENLQALVAIKCLDEGVNIPSIKTAFILASSTNPKEYIQRRGRVLRKFPGKDYAVIFDNLEKDPMCLAKADKAYMDLVDKLEVEHDLFMKVVEANLVYDKASVNYYDANTKEITISMFDNMNNEQSLFMFDYLNEKYGTNFNSKDLRTRFLFTVLHELGHYVDFSNKEKVGEFDSYTKDDAEQRTIVRAMTDEIKSWKAYREIPAEMLADKFAVEQMIKYYPELAYGER